VKSHNHYALCPECERRIAELERRIAVLEALLAAERRALSGAAQPRGEDE
jgi:uncharacterized coiled-coil protein SlyX